VAGKKFSFSPEKHRKSLVRDYKSLILTPENNRNEIRKYQEKLFFLCICGQTHGNSYYCRPMEQYVYNLLYMDCIRKTNDGLPKLKIRKNI